MLKGFLAKVKSPTVIPRAQHQLSRSMINPNALKVLNRLHEAGYSAFLVGGCVRDLLLDRHPKDFDIATNALPEEIRKLFRNCRLIGKRFRLAHIVFGKEIIEVATFRTHHKDASTLHGHTHEGMIIRDNVFGTIEDDAWRRDFTVNALYYNIADFSVIDYTGGMHDLQTKTLRIIGDAEQRFHEDPVRLLRAVRIVGKLKLTISPETEAPLLKLSYLLSHVSPARLFQEVLKFFQEGATLNTFKLLQKYNLLAPLFPATNEALKNPQAMLLLEEALRSTDHRWNERKTVSPAFLFAVFLWHPIKEAVEKNIQNKLSPHIAYDKGIRDVIREQTKTLTIPRRLSITIYEICFLQYRFTCRYGSTPHRLLDHLRFRAAYDLLLLRAISGEEVDELSTWWTKFISGTAPERDQLIKEVASKRPTRKKKFRRQRTAKPNKIVSS